MTRLLYNVTAFMRKDQPLSVDYRPGPDVSWPIHLQIGPGGDDTIDVFASVADATRLRDALSAQIDLAAEAS